MIKQDLDLLQVLAHSPLATAIYDNPNIRIAFANHAMLEMWCVGPEIIGQDFRVVFPSFTREGFASILEKVWNSGITYRATETPAIIVDGAEQHIRYFDFEYKALIDESGNTYAILHTATEVTSRIAATSQLRIQEEQLSFNNDLETLTHTLSHDIKNPLSVAKLGLNYLINQHNLDSKTITKWYKMISEALTSVENIVNQTVQLSDARSIANHHRVYDMITEIPIWCQQIQLLYSAFNGRIQLGQLLPIYGDIGAIYQIFMNIIGNAVKYSSSAEEPKIEIHSEKTDKGTVYFIQDNGIGIPESELEKVFCVFKRASNASDHHGTGIGLCLAKRIIERYAGSINISSEQGRGTLVRLFFADQ